MIRSRARRWLRWTLRGLAALVLVGVVLPLAAVAAILFTEAGTDLAGARGLGFYDGMIPGAARGVVSGTIGETLVLTDVHLADRNGGVLVSADRIELSPDLAALTRGTIRIESARFEGVVVTANGAWGDLGPEPDPDEEPEPEPPKEGFGPDMPRIEVDALELADTEILLLDGETPSTLLNIEALAIDAAGDGHDARANLETTLSAPAYDVTVRPLALTVAWRDPVAVVERLDVTGNVGTVAIRDVLFDVSDFHWGVGSLDLRPDSAWLTRQTDAIPADLKLTVGGSAPDGELDLRLDADVPTASVDLELTGTLPGFSAADLNVALDCDPCGQPGRQARLETHVVANAEHQTASLEGTLLAGKTQLGLRGSVDEQRVLHAGVSWESKSLAELESMLAPFEIRAGLKGRTKGVVNCHGTLDPREIGCSVEADVRGFPPLEQAGIKTEIQIDGGIHASIERLAAQIPSHGFRLVGGPAKIDVVEGGVQVSNLTIEEGNGHGALAIAGQYDPKGASDLRVGIRAFQLEALDPVAAGSKPRGVLDGTIRAQGTPEDLTVTAEIRGKGLGATGKRIGDLELSARIDPKKSRVDLALQDGPLGTLSGRVRAPVGLDASGGGVVMGGGPIQAHLGLKGFELERLEELAGVSDLRGTVGFDVDLSGRLARPRIAASIEARDVVFANLELGDLHVDAGYGGPQAQVQVELHGPLTKFTRIQAVTPARLDLARGRVRWLRTAPHELHAVIVGAKLGAVPLEGGPKLGGQVHANLDLVGPLARADVRAQVNVAGLQVDGHTVGNLDLDVATDGETTDVKFGTRGPSIGALTVDAHAPVGMDLLAAEPRWDLDAPNTLDVRLRAVDLEELAALAPGLLATGRARARITVEGTARQPRGRASLTVERAGWGDMVVDELRTNASFGKGLVHGDVLVRNGGGDLLARGVAPVTIDVPNAAVTWRSQEEHELVVDIHDIDAGSIAPLAELPENVDLSVAGQIEARGSTQHLLTRGQVRTDLVVPGMPRYAVETDIDVTERKQHVEVRILDGKRPEATIVADAGVDLIALQGEGYDIDGAPVSFAMDAEGISLDRFGPVMPVAIHDPAGVLKAHVKIDGTVGTPKMQGSLGLAKGAVTLTTLRQRFTDLGFQLNFDNDSIRLKSLDLHSGSGVLGLKGGVKFGPKGIDGRVDLHLDRMPLRQPPLPSMRVSGDIATTLELGKSESSVDVAIAGAKLEVMSLGASGAAEIPRNVNVQYVDAAGLRAASLARAPEVDPNAPPPSVLRAKLHLDDPLLVRGPAVSMAWTGALAGTLSPEIRVEGGFRSQQSESQFDLLGNTFEIEQGTITLAQESGLEPFVDVVAHTQVENVRITATIRGRITHAELHLTSDPPEKEQDIFAMLVTGTANTANADSDSVTAQAASALAALSTPALQRGVGDKLGIDTMRLGFGESLDEPIVSMGKNIRKRVYAEATFHGNAPRDENRTEFMVRYRFLPKWALEVFYGDRNVGGVGLWWIRLFDRALPGDPPRDRSEGGTGSNRSKK